MTRALRIVGSEEGASDTRRAERRTNVFLSATVQTAFGSTPARIRDISRCGAMIEADIQQPIGSTVIFARGDLSLPAIVVWCSGKKSGLQFRGSIDEDAFLPLIGKSKAPPTKPLRPLFPSHSIQ